MEREIFILEICEIRGSLESQQHQMKQSTKNNEKMNFDINALLKSGQNLGEDESLEILKLTKDDAHIYKMPPMSSSEGHTTDEFKDLVFRGKMKMFVKMWPFCLYYT